jgi:mRNA-degrading endonuclease HigB of HigAB toxin-antitoxin module
VVAEWTKLKSDENLDNATTIVEDANRRVTDAPECLKRAESRLEDSHPEDFITRPTYATLDAYVERARQAFEAALAANRDFEVFVTGSIHKIELMTKHSNLKTSELTVEADNATLTVDADTTLTEEQIFDIDHSEDLNDHINQKDYANINQKDYANTITLSKNSFLQTLTFSEKNQSVFNVNTHEFKLSYMESTNAEHIFSLYCAVHKNYEQFRISSSNQSSRFDVKVCVCRIKFTATGSGRAAFNTRDCRFV